MMQTDVQSVHLEATATAITGRTRVKGYQVLGGGTAGEILMNDGGVSGTLRLQFNISASTNYPFSVLIPGEGILFQEDVYVTLPNLAKITIFYG